MDDSKTETDTALFGDIIEDYIDKNITGYEFDKVENLPLTISADKEENVIKVYYKKSEFGYSIEYYYDTVKDDTKTVTDTALFGDTIDSYGDKNITGYKFDKTENKPLTITEVAADNVMKVYYVKDSFGYTVEYYYDGVIDSSKTITNTALFGSTITIDDIDTVTNKTAGYELEKTEGLSLTITAVAANNVIKVYYSKPVITVVKTSEVITNRTTGAENTVEYNETITYTITATNTGSVAGNVTIADVAPTGTTLVEGSITATGYTSVTEAQLADGIVLTVPANGGTASVTFNVTVIANAGSDVVNTPKVNGTEDTTNTVTNPVEKTVSVKAKTGTQTITNSNIVIVLDTSKSMDSKVSSTGTTRLATAKEVVNNFINNMDLPDTETTNSCAVTVIYFNENAGVVGTADTSSEATTLKTAVSALGMNRGTNMATGLTLAKTELETLAAARPDNNNIVIFVSDGQPSDSSSTISSAATALKNATLNPTVYTVAFGSDISILRDTIATDSTKYYTTETSGSLSEIFSTMTNDFGGVAVPTQSTDGLIELTGIYADSDHPIKITVGTTSLTDITSLPTDKLGYVILGDDGKYYLDVSKFEAGATVSIEYYSNSSNS